MPSRKLRYFAPVVAALIATTSCDEQGFDRFSGPAQGFSVAYDKWAPGPNDTCSRDQHNNYSTVGPDGKVYPTWHPPEDPATGCSFGHEHGRDPRGSALYNEVGDIPFGYVNEQLDVYDPGGQRHEDHVGQKIEWEDAVEFDFGGDAPSALLRVECDVLTKLHQGSHSKDAFTNNVHELVLHVSCTDKTRFSVSLLTPIGTPGELVASCDRERHITAGTATPANSPDGGGKRAIPDRQCIEEFMLVADGERSSFSRALRESWEISDRLRTEDGHTLVSFNPYFQVRFPSRFFDPDMPDGVGRPLDWCFQETVDGRKARGDLCDESTNEGQVASLAFDDPRSAFNGAQRFVDLNSFRISNAEGPTIWYTDPFGNNGSPEPFPGSVVQFIAKVEHQRASNPSGPAIGRDRDYAGGGVHAPN